MIPCHNIFNIGVKLHVYSSNYSLVEPACSTRDSESLWKFTSMMIKKWKRTIHSTLADESTRIELVLFSSFLACPSPSFLTAACSSRWSCLGCRLGLLWAVLLLHYKKCCYTDPEKLYEGVNLYHLLFWNLLTSSSCSGSKVSYVLADVAANYQS